jgi:hypothetical protein
MYPSVRESNSLVPWDVVPGAFLFPDTVIRAKDPPWRSSCERKVRLKDGKKTCPM